MMSADNWAICPKCGKEPQYPKPEYGKMTEAEYLEALKHSEEPHEQRTTLREDYELGIMQDGMFYVRYKGQCSKCGFSFVFKEDINTLKARGK